MKQTFNKKNVVNIKTRMKFLITISLLAILMPLQEVTAFHANPAPDWLSPGGYTLNDGGVGLAPSVIINVTDISFQLNSVIDTIPIIITSTEDPFSGISLTLTENAVDDGVFGNTNLIFMTGNAQFTVADTATITIFDDNPATGNADPFAVDTLASGNAALVISSSDPAGFEVTNLIETGPNTSTFTATIRFSNIATDPATNTILVQGGDVISIIDEITGEFTNGLIVPNPFAGIGAIEAANGGTVTATYSALSTSVPISSSAAPGRGGGGLVRPGLVLDFVAGGGGSSDKTAPSLTISRSQITGLGLLDEVLHSILEADPFTPLTALYDSSIDYPLSINGDGFLLSQHANTIQTFQGNTGEPIQFKLNLFDSTGVEHVALYTNLRGYEREIQNSDTYIIYDEGKPLEITDPEGFFSNVNFTVSDEGTKYVITYDLVFANPMDTSDIIIRAWDQKRNSGDVKIFDAIKIDGNTIVEPSPNTLVQTETTSMSVPYFKVLKSLTPVADSVGNLRYYNSFGNLEQKQAHPHYEPFTYPQNVGRAERHDDGFKNTITVEDITARAVAQTLIGNPFTESKDRPIHEMFVYPNNVGKLDRGDVEKLQESMLDEHAKAIKYFYKRYHTNHVED